MLNLLFVELVLSTSIIPKSSVVTFEASWSIIINPTSFSLNTKSTYMFAPYSAYPSGAATSLIIYLYVPGFSGLGNFDKSIFCEASVPT
ncbi:hypothetical protein D3C72_1191030 [compost metagenome]